MYKSGLIEKLVAERVARCIRRIANGETWIARITSQTDGGIRVGIHRRRDKQTMDVLTLTPEEVETVEKEDGLHPRQRAILVALVDKPQKVAIIALRCRCAESRLYDHGKGLKELREMGLVELTTDGYALTPKGRIAAEAYAAAEHREPCHRCVNGHEREPLAL